MDLPVKNIVSEIDLKPSDAFLPLFESVVNSIISLKRSNAPNKKIQIQIERGDLPINVDIDLIKTIQSLKIIDNGEGFTDANLNSFKTAYSRTNLEYGCKGIGRFTVLAGFEKIHITSHYQENGKWQYREILFDSEKEVQVVREIDSEAKERKTIVELVNCYNPAIKDYTAKSVNEIAELIMQHCLIYYLCNDLPRIEVLDLSEKEPQIAIVNDLYSALSKEQEKEFPIGDINFTCFVTKTGKTNNRKNHYFHYCANSRLVGNSKSIARVNGLFAYPIVEHEIAYFLDVYVVSEYLNKKVYSSRNGFEIPQNRDNLFNQDYELTFDEIETALAKGIEDLYNDFVKETQNRNIREIHTYIQNNAPRYKRYLDRPEILAKMPPNLSDDKKEEWLYGVSFKEKKSIDSKIQKFIDDKDITEDTIVQIQNELREKTIYDADNLSDYMLRRKAVIDIFKKFLDADRDGKYRLEEDIHNLIFPMGVINKGIKYENHNLWLLDERFAIYDFIASDTPITSMSQKKSRLETDIVMVDKPKMFDNPISFGAESSGEISSMVIFEFKRPGETAHQKSQNDTRWKFDELIDKYFEAFLYADNKKGKNYRGNTIVLRQDTPKFGYIIVDVIPPQLESYNITNGYRKTAFGTLYKINPDLNLHYEVITFNQLIRAVETRHAPFFDKLFQNQ